MDVTFVRESGESFTMELNYFNTFIGVKEIIEKYHNIPISKQILLFDNQLLDDSDIVFMTDITHASTILLRIAPDTPIKNPEPKVAPATAPEETSAPATAPEEAPAKAPHTPPITSKSKTLSVTMVRRAIRGEENFIVSEIEYSYKVSEFKKFLERHNSSVLPQDGHYFFIHDHFVMYEDRSFQWHGVKDGDIIEIFEGLVDNNYLGDTCI